MLKVIFAILSASSRFKVLADGCVSILSVERYYIKSIVLIYLTSIEAFFHKRPTCYFLCATNTGPCLALYIATAILGYRSIVLADAARATCSAVMSIDLFLTPASDAATYGNNPEWQKASRPIFRAISAGIVLAAPVSSKSFESEISKAHSCALAALLKLIVPSIPTQILSGKVRRKVFICSARPDQHERCTLKSGSSVMVSKRTLARSTMTSEYGPITSCF